MIRPTTRIGTMNFVDLPIAEVRHLKSPNPNKMGEDKFELLKKGIDHHGFLQPILLVVEDDGYVLIDGEHRIRACDELGYADIIGVVAPDREAAEALRISLNRLRGELDMSAVGRELVALHSLGYDVELAGVSTLEAEALMSNVTVVDEDDLLDGMNLAADDEVKPKTFNMTFKFKTESQRARVRELLGPHGETIEDALVAVLRETQ